ncbi:MAG TPA: ABC transporter permease [Methanomassiliicoccales archaeon]|nr:ABC transporter permease [Methanomassiliicoccales archaeon]
MPRLRAVTTSFRHQALVFFADPQWLIPNIIAPFVLTMVALLLYRDVTGPIVLYAILGGGMMGMWGNTLYASGFSIQSERWWGTMESVFAVPSSLIWIIAGRTLWNALIGLLNGFVVLVFATVMFHQPVQVQDMGLFVLAFSLTLLSLSCLGLVFSSAFVLTRSASVLTNGLEFPIYVGTGTMFPIALLPFWTHPLSLSLGPTWGIDAIRYAALGSSQGSFAQGYWGDLAIMAVLSVVYLAAAVLLFVQVDKVARRDASLGRF